PLIIKVASIQAARMQVYFIDNEDYFQRKFLLTDENDQPFEDNDERAIFFARGVLETVIKLRWAPDIIHCHGWLSALVPLYIKKYYHDDPLYKQSKVIYSVYNDEFPESLDQNFSKKLLLEGITPEDVKILENPTYENISRLAIDYSDAIIQGSEKINPEIQQYIQMSKKLFLAFQPKETYIDAYNEFYDKI
ncbi:MAG TPA: glycogen/starch synthase, partial [Prolixibacteraceae bacterium]|nr:glycogen/starch synthase [Prolixibacteraceae bacterium]